jgi:hypothetical protein
MIYLGCALRYYHQLLLGCVHQNNGCLLIGLIIDERTESPKGEIRIMALRTLIFVL